jgi:hypothetical protein
MIGQEFDKAGAFFDQKMQKMFCLNIFVEK